MKIATVFDNSDPVSMIRKHNGMISVDNKKVITSALSFCLTKAPMTPKEVNRKYSKGLVFDVVLRNGYRKSGMWAGNRERWRVQFRSHSAWIYACLSKMTHLLRIDPLFLHDLRHIEVELEHCRLDWKREQSGLEEREEDRQR